MVLVLSRDLTRPYEQRESNILGKVRLRLVTILPSLVAIGTAAMDMSLVFKEISQDHVTKG